MCHFTVPLLQSSLTTNSVSVSRFSLLRVCACVCMCLGLNQSVVEFRGLVCPFFCGLLSDKMVKWQHQSADTSLTPQVGGQWKYNFTDKNWIAFYCWLDRVCIIFKGKLLEFCSYNFLCCYYQILIFKSDLRLPNIREPSRTRTSGALADWSFWSPRCLKTKKTSFYFLSLKWLRPNSF